MVKVVCFILCDFYHNNKTLKITMETVKRFMVASFGGERDEEAEHRGFLRQ